MILTSLFTDNNLIKKARAGDKSAFGRLFRRHGPQVLNILRRLTGGDEIAEDLTQETFIAAYESLHSWRGEGAFATWLCGIAIRKYALARRSNFRNPATEELDEDESVTFVANDDPLAHLERREAEEALARAVDELPETCREVFILIRMESMAYKDVAGLLNIPLGTVQSRLNRATKCLYKRLTPLIYGTDATVPAYSEKVVKHVIR